MNSNITKSEKEKPNKRDLGLIIAIGLLVFGILALFIPFDRINGAKIGSFTINIDRYNNLGDFMGGVTAPFFSGAAFLLLYMTYKSQKKELEESQKILRTQNEVMTKQQFETTFFNMINLHNQIVIQMSIIYNVPDEYGNILKRKEVTVGGRECFVRFYMEFRDEYYNQLGKKNNYSESRQFIDYVYNSFFEKRETILGHYFRNLYHIVKFVHNSNISNQKEYTNILRAQLSTQELLLLHFNCLSQYGAKFKPLVEDYSLLKNISGHSELEQYECNSFYDPKAFGK